MADAMTVLVLGAFEVLHRGQIEFLNRASRFGTVTVGLTSDRLLEETKRPAVFTYDERREALESLGYRVVERSEPSARALFLDLAPEVFACGNDWIDADHLDSAGIDRDFLNAYDVTVVYTPRPHGLSSTEFLRRVREAV